MTWEISPLLRPSERLPESELEAELGLAVEHFIAHIRSPGAHPHSRPRRAVSVIGVSSGSRSAFPRASTGSAKLGADSKGGGGDGSAGACTYGSRTSGIRRAKCSADR